MSRCVFLGMFAVLAYTTAMMYEPEQVGYSKADRDGMARLVQQVSEDPNERRYRLEIPFGCDDKRCLTAWAERPHPKAVRAFAKATR